MGEKEERMKVEKEEKKKVYFKNSWTKKNHVKNSAPNIPYLLKTHG